MPTFNDGESGSSVRAKINTVIDKVDGVTAIDNDITITGDLTVDTNTLHVDSANNRVGIGTTSPQSALDVAGDIRLSANNKVYTDGGNLTISADNNNSGAGSAVNILVDGAEMADFNNAGYLRFDKANFAGGGICTQSLDSTLNLAGGSNPANSGLNIALSGPDHTAGSAGFLMRDGTATVYAYQRLTDAHLWYTDGSERMRVTSGGNVGIGTTNPGSKLSIVGLPTSSAGLSAGDIWNDSGTLKIVT